MMRSLPLLLLASCGYITDDEYLHRVGGSEDASDLSVGSWTRVSIPDSAGVTDVRTLATPGGDVVVVWSEAEDGNVEMARLVDGVPMTRRLAEGGAGGQFDAAFSPSGIALTWTRPGVSEVFIETGFTTLGSTSTVAAETITSVGVSDVLENLNIVVREDSKRTVIYDHDWNSFHWDENDLGKFDERNAQSNLDFGRELDAIYNGELYIVAAEVTTVDMQVHTDGFTETELFLAETSEHLVAAPRVVRGPDGAVHAAWLAWPLYTDKEYAELWYGTNAGGSWQIEMVDAAVDYADRIGLAAGPDGPRLCYPRAWTPNIIYAERDGEGWRREVVTPDGGYGGDCNVVAVPGGGVAVIYSRFESGIEVSYR